MNTRQAARRGAVAGGIAGAATLAVMYLAAGLIGISPLPQLLQQPLLNAMPGPVFGFLIDTLQHAGKVLEELGLLAALIGWLAVWGGLYGWLSMRRPLPRLSLGFAGGAWLVVVGILLPVSGQGFLGLNGGLTTPLMWALLFVIYAVVLELLFTRPWDLIAGPATADPGRRRLISLLPVAIAAGAVGVLGLRLIPGWYQSIVGAPEAVLKGPVPALTPVENFYVVSKNFGDPVVQEAGWALAVRGLVDSPLKLSAADLRAMPSVTQFVTLECVSNNVGGDLMSTGSFTGVSLKEILNRAGARPAAGAVAFHAQDGYSESIPVSLVMGAPEILVAYALDGAPLPDRHGFPARVLIPGHYGMKGPKWLQVIELVSQEINGYWENQGWDRQAVIKTTARFDAPTDGQVSPRGEVSVGGVAFAGTRGISAVEWSSDGGSSWTPADLKAPLGPLTWTLWSAAWTPPREGAYTLKVRARDGDGTMQTATTAPSYPNGSSGYHTIRVNIAK